MKGCAAAQRGQNNKKPKNCYIKMKRGDVRLGLSQPPNPPPPTSFFFIWEKGRRGEEG